MIEINLDSPLLTTAGILSVVVLLVLFIVVEILRFYKQDKDIFGEKILILRLIMIPVGLFSGLIILTRFLIMLRILK